MMRNSEEIEFTTKQFANVIKNGYKGQTFYGGEEIIALFVKRFRIVIARFAVHTTTDVPELFFPAQVDMERRGALVHHMFPLQPASDHYCVVGFHSHVSTVQISNFTNESLILAIEDPMYRNPVELLSPAAVLTSHRCLLLQNDGNKLEGVVTERIIKDNCITSYEVMVDNKVLGRFGPGRVLRHPGDRYGDEDCVQLDAKEVAVNDKDACSSSDMDYASDEIENFENADADSGDGGAPCEVPTCHDDTQHSASRKRPVSKAEVQRWRQETLITFLETVIAYNPFVKDSGSSIDDKWNRVSEEMANSTAHLGEDRVTCNAKTEAILKRQQGSESVRAGWI
jgi:hypothetical protein